MPTKIDQTRLCYSPMSKRIVLARFGERSGEVLETRDAMSEFLQTLVLFAFGDVKPEEGAEAVRKFGGGEEQFEIRMTRIADLKNPKN